MLDCAKRDFRICIEGWCTSCLVGTCTRLSCQSLPQLNVIKWCNLKVSPPPTEDCGVKHLCMPLPFLLMLPYVPLLFMDVTPITKQLQTNPIKQFFVCDIVIISINNVKACTLCQYMTIHVFKLTCFAHAFITWN